MTAQEYVESIPLKEGGARIEFGSTDVVFVPATAINDLQQIRESYDDAELQELADRIPLNDNEGNISFTLINPPTVAVFPDEASVGNYIAQHAEYYGIDLESDPMVALQPWNGAYYVRVNGHRRGRAIELKCRQEGLPIESVMVSSTLLYNPTFDEARCQQYIENTTSAITPVEDAKAIEREYVWRWRGQNDAMVDISVQRQRVAELSEFFGFGTAKIRAALYFISMPEDISTYVNSGLSYTNVVDLARLREAYANQRDYEGFAKYNSEQADQKMRDYFEVVILKRLQGSKKGTIGEAIDGKIREVTKTTPYEVEELFVIDEAGMEAQTRERVRREITQAAILALRFSKLSREDAEKLMGIVTQRLAALAVDEALSNNVEPLLLDSH